MSRRSRRTSPKVLSTTPRQTGEPYYRSSLDARLPRLQTVLVRSLEPQGLTGRLQTRIPGRWRPLIQQAARPEWYPRQRPINLRHPVRSWRRSSPLQTVVSQARHDFCSKRQARREVLFAKQIAGRSGGSPGRRGHYRRTSLSSTSCGR